MAIWFIEGKEVSLKEFKNYLRGDSNVVEDVVEKEENKVKTKTEELFDELTNNVGFSHKRAKKVTEEYKSKKDLIDNLKELPFSKVENETLISYFGKKVIKKIKKKENKGEE